MADSDTRSRLLDAGRSLMLARGYHATTIDEICAGAAVSKGSFYHFFPDKESYGLALLERFYREGVARVRTGRYATILDPRGRLDAFMEHVERIAPAFWQHGCLMGAFATELAESNPTIHARVAALFDELVAGVTPLFQAVVGDRAEGAAFAEEMLMMLEGSIILARAHGDPERIAAGLRRFRRSVAARLDPAEPAGVE